MYNDPNIKAWSSPKWIPPDAGSDATSANGNWEEWEREDNPNGGDEEANVSADAPGFFRRGSSWLRRHRGESARNTPGVANEQPTEKPQISHHS